MFARAFRPNLIASRYQKHVGVPASASLYATASGQNGYGPNCTPKRGLAQDSRSNIKKRRKAGTKGHTGQYQDREQGSLVRQKRRPWTNELEAALARRDIDAVIAAYGTFKQRKLSISPPTETDITILLVQSLRKGLKEAGLKENQVRNSQKQEMRQASEQQRLPNMVRLEDFADRLVSDIRGRVLSSNPSSIAQLLMFYRVGGMVEKGVSFWQWLRVQESSFANPAVYGAAIALLAVSGTPLPELESLYSEAIERFPEGFRAYKLSPQAIVSNRDAGDAGDGLSLRLLHGISFARCMHGDMQGAYLGLDTALRLRPALTSNDFFIDFMEQRPISEALTLFATACRAGNCLKLGVRYQLVDRIRNNAIRSGGPLAKVIALRQMLSATYLTLVAGGTLSKNMLNTLLIALTDVVKSKDIIQAQPEQRNRIVTAVIGLVRRMLGTFMKFDHCQPGVAAFNAIIGNVGGFGKSEDIIKTVLDDMRSMNLDPTLATYRSILAAAGRIGNQALVVESWGNLTEFLASTGAQVGVSDVWYLVHAARHSGANELARKVLDEFGGTFTRLENEILEANHPSTESSTETSWINHENVIAEVESALEQLEADLNVLDKKTESQALPLNLRGELLPMALNITHSRTEMAEPELRKIYDGMTTDPSVQTHAGAASSGKEQDPSTEPLLASPEDVQPAVSLTRIPFGELRFENWKTMNYLLQLSERNETEYRKAVEQAVSAGLTPPSREDASLSSCRIDQGMCYGLSDMASLVADEPTNGAKVEEVRHEILRLRGRLPEATQL